MENLAKANNKWSIKGQTINISIIFKSNITFNMTTMGNLWNARALQIHKNRFSVSCLCQSSE
jgi:hypothetical protein